MSRNHLAICLLALGAASLPPFAVETLADVIDPSAFSKKVDITFTGVQEGVVLADFPVLVRLSASISGFSYDDFASTDGSDLRFADSHGNMIPHEIDTWSTSGESTIWVKVPQLARNMRITAYYGSANPPAAASASAVWSNGYVGVWHLGESALPMAESSAVSSGFTSSNGTGILFAQAGRIGGSVDFGASNNSRVLIAPDHAALDGFTQCTFEAWTYVYSQYRSGGDKDKGLLSKRGTSNTDRSSYYFFQSENTATAFYGSASGNGSSEFSRAVVADSDAWTYQTYTFDGGMTADNVKGWKNGQNVGTSTKSDVTKLYAGSADLYLGNFGHRTDNNTFDTRNFPGKIDEVRISNVARSADWIKASHDTVAASGFASYVARDAVLPDQVDWFTNGVIACSIQDYDRDDNAYVYTFRESCSITVLTNLHITTLEQPSLEEKDYGYFLAGEKFDLNLSGTLLGLTAEIVDPDTIPSAVVTPSGEYSEERIGAYTVYTFTGIGVVTVNKPGRIDLALAGGNGGETIPMSRIILNGSTAVSTGIGAASTFGPYTAAAGTGGDPGYVTVRVWEPCVLYAGSVGISSAELRWGVAAMNATVDVKLMYGTSKTAPDRVTMLAADAVDEAGGSAELAGLDPETTYYARLYVDSGAGYEAVGEMISFTTEPLLAANEGGRSISVIEPVTPGLRAGYINENNVNVATNNSSITWLPEPQLGIIAATNSTSNLSDKTYPPIWVNNRAWVFTGYMKFEKDCRYQFGESIDDYTTLKIDGANVIADSSYNNFANVNVYYPEGWHHIEVRFANGTGGGGVYNSTKDSKGQLCGFGYAKVPASNTSKPANMQALEWLCDPGDGSLLAMAPQQAITIDVEGFVIEESQYVITVSNAMNKMVSARVYYGESSDINALTNGVDSFSIDIELEPYEVCDVELEWEEDVPPNYVVEFPFGTSTIQSFSASSRVAVSVKSVGADSAVLTTGVGFDLDVTGDTPQVALTAYFGPVDAGTSGTGWAKSQSFGTAGAGTYDFTLTGLELGSMYVVRMMAEDEDGGTVWSDPVSFGVSGVYLGDTVDLYENDPRTQAITVHRTGSVADLARTVTVFLEYSGAGLDSVSQLPGSVTFEAGSATAEIPFTPVDNSRKDGSRSFTATLLSGSSYTAISPGTSTVTIVDDESADGDVVTWTGAAKDMNWDTPANWDKASVPRPIDTARFTDAGLAPGATVSIASAAGVRTLQIDTALAFTLGGSGSLAVNSVLRSDTDGVAEGRVTIAVPVTVGNAGNSFTTWNIAGSEGIELAAALTASAGIQFMKDGSGGLWLSAPETEYPGPWYIYGGDVFANARNSVGGTVNVGSGIASARLAALVDNAFAATIQPSAFANGTYSSRLHGSAASSSSRVTVWEGGVAKLGARYGAHQVYMTGGRVEGVVWSFDRADQKIVTSASSETALFNADYRIGTGPNPLDVTVADGKAVVDLLVGGRIYYGAAAASPQYLTKFGAGTMRTTADWTGMSLRVDIAAGRVLVDNPSADGLGNQGVSVAPGAVLGGTGFLGGTTAAYETECAVTVEGEGNNEGQIAPGTVDGEGNHVFGTLTVGSPAAPGSVSFADYSKFTAHVGADGVCDLLQVNGTASIAEGNGTVINVLCDSLSSVRAGDYVLMRATGGLSGTFFRVSVPGAGWTVSYTGTEVVLTVPLRGRRLIIR